MSEVKNIENRPKELGEIEFYNELPNMPVKIDLSGSIGQFLAYDIFDLDGVQPIETGHLNVNNKIIGVNPSKASIEIYKKKNTKFQLVYVIVNAYGFKEVNGELVGKPYNISLHPASKRGEVSVVTPEWIEKIDLEEMDSVPRLYKGFNPFCGAYGLHMIGTVDYSNIESDMLGFVHRMYALAMPIEHREITSPEIPQLNDNKQVRRDYEKYRKDRYFKPFRKVKPRRIWGCDSPIELFLLQAMDSIGLAPELQTIICEDGFTVPSFHKLWENQRSRRRLKMITEADYYFPDKKLAVFCDSVAHHSSAEAIKKDAAIDEKLKEIDITSMRICGRDIANSPIECAKKIEQLLVELA
ncbi:hypothetical protein [Aliivibrio fischeri]|uniref:hypothetical protein n=1 Tax=Aliivibrio fischeri TaxID=668 RepID=UPI00196B1CC6|nr:hypothetical protein [Aliivibrio fischeri]